MTHTQFIIDQYHNNGNTDITVRVASGEQSGSKFMRLKVELYRDGSAFAIYGQTHPTKPGLVYDCKNHKAALEHFTNEILGKN